MAIKPKQRIILLLGCLLAATACFSQPLPPPGSVPKPVVTGHARNWRIASTEICGNNIDDDGNGLADEKDFACYYTSTATGCPVSSIVWVVTSGSVYWMDAATGATGNVGPSGGLLDIAWSSDGRLFGMTTGSLVELNPYNAQVVSTLSVPGFSLVNAMTGDGKGNLYMTAIATSATPGPIGTLYVIKYNLATGQVSLVANLTQARLSSGGDLSFLNGYLYLSCGGKTLGAINIATGAVTEITLNTTLGFTGFGLMTLGDGYLYITAGNTLYRIDPSNWSADATPYLNFPSSGVLVNGLSTYAEHCNAPHCTNPGILVTAGAPPYCAAPGLPLSAAGSGIVGPDTIEWTLPNGMKAGGRTLLAKLSGAYTVRYHSVPDDCGHDTSFTLSLLPNPDANMGGDTALCPGTQLRLSPKNPAGISGFLWQDGSTGPEYLVTTPGIYSLQATNACGSSQASVRVRAADLPRALLPADTVLCSFDTLLLMNAGHADGDSYRWQDGSTVPTFTARGPGIYWADVSNQCGTVRDSIVIGPRATGCDRRVSVPNAFTPGSPSNGLFRPVITGPLQRYEFMVYNRWGQLLFNSTRRGEGWDGRINGYLQQPGIYVWACRYTFAGLPAAQERGTVLLLR